MRLSLCRTIAKPTHETPRPANCYWVADIEALLNQRSKSRHGVIRFLAERMARERNSVKIL